MDVLYGMNNDLSLVKKTIISFPPPFFVLFCCDDSLTLDYKHVIGWIELGKRIPGWNSFLN